MKSKILYSVMIEYGLANQNTELVGVDNVERDVGE